MGRLPFARSVVEESIRLYPAIWLIPRRAIVNDEIGSHAIPAGTDVLVNVYGLHRHPRHWDRPDQFDPDRFGGTAAGQRAPFTYLPFGAGATSCLGSRLALTETILTIVALVRRWSVETALLTVPAPQADLTLRPRPPLHLRLRPRRESAL
jgi:cytochrome P450